ncbi:MAG: VWA domain-containing protein [Crocinitomicaceae bacterium]|nr:VWA domain-containing protein [Crocinitomicaceae bacterium]
MRQSILILMGVCLALNSSAQRGYGTSSASYAYHHGGNGYILPSENVVEEEIFNYHTHLIDAATYNSPINLSHAWGNENINANADEVILQIGLSTHRDTNLSSIPPANLSFVVDISGSMGGDPIEKSKAAMKEFVKQLRPSDQISLVLFGSSVFVPYKSQKIGDKKALLAAIDNIQINGSTNVHLGMQTGYQQVASTFLSTGNNRVIVFTDAMANTGVIDPNQILANTSVYIKDIDLTFIGIGINFNQDFARQIKTKLRGHMHFVEDAREINKLFRDEVEQFLAAPYGKKVKLTIEIPEQLTLNKFYGYNPTITGNKIEIEIDDMQGGLTQIFMLKFNRKKEYEGEIDQLSYQLSFNNQHDQPEIITKHTSQINVLQNNDIYNKLVNREVKKNYSIVYMANQLKQASIDFEADRDGEKYDHTINQVLAVIDGEHKTLDEDLKYVYDILSKQTDDTKKAKVPLLLADNF